MRVGDDDRAGGMVKDPERGRADHGGGQRSMAVTAHDDALRLVRFLDEPAHDMTVVRQV
jgi:hypothetical protein